MGQGHTIASRPFEASSPVSSGSLSVVQTAAPKRSVSAFFVRAKQLGQRTLDTHPRLAFGVGLAFCSVVTAGVCLRNIVPWKREQGLPFRAACAADVRHNMNPLNGPYCRALDCLGENPSQQTIKQIRRLMGLYGKRFYEPVVAPLTELVFGSNQSSLGSFIKNMVAVRPALSVSNGRPSGLATDP